MHEILSVVRLSSAKLAAFSQPEAQDGCVRRLVNCHVVRRSRVLCEQGKSKKKAIEGEEESDYDSEFEAKVCQNSYHNVRF